MRQLCHTLLRSTRERRLPSIPAQNRMQHAGLLLPERVPALLCNERGQRASLRQLPLHAVVTFARVGVCGFKHLQALVTVVEICRDAAGQGETNSCFAAATHADDDNRGHEATKLLLLLLLLLLRLMMLIRVSVQLQACKTNTMQPKLNNGT